MTISKDTTPKTFCFVLMPFSDKFDDVYRLGIKDACTTAGAYCERVDEQTFHERILDRIYNQIAKADIVIADMTDRNPNVFYEVGYAHALGKLTILLTQNVDDIPFDLKHFPHIVYGSKISMLRDELEKRVKYFIESPPTKSSDIKIGLELYVADQNLASGKAIHLSPLDKIPSPEFTVFNSSGDTYAKGEFKIGLLTSERFDVDIDTVITRLPQGGHLHMLPEFPTLFPNAYASCKVRLDSRTGQYLGPEEEEQIIVRLFTRQGNWDFPLILRKRK